VFESSFLDPTMGTDTVDDNEMGKFKYTRPREDTGWSNQVDMSSPANTLSLL